MAGFNPSDNTYQIVKETVGGTTPATPAFLTIEHIPGTMPELTANTVTSPTLQSSRASAGSRKTGYSVNGGLSVHFRRHTAIDLLLESALSGTFSTNVLKASNVDTSFTIQKSMKNGAGTTDYKRFKGNQVASWTLTCAADGVAESTFDVIGMSQDASAAAVAGATAGAVTSGVPLVGLDVSAVTIAGVTGVFNSLELSVTHEREAQTQFGSTASRGIGTSGFRTVQLTLTMYRDSISQTTALDGDTAVAVSFTIGSAANGYTITLPKANVDVPKDMEDGSKGLIQMVFMASYDTTTATDLSITKLV